MPEPMIDVHSHELLPAFRTVAAEGDYAAMMPSWSIEEHIEIMDQKGIDICVLSVPEAVQSLTGAAARTLARTLNVGLAEIVASHPARFGALAVVPMGDMDAAIDEMAYALDVLKLDGVSTETHFHGNYLGEDAYDPWFAEMDRRGATLFVHPATPPGFEQAKSRINVSILDFMFETTRMIANMVLSGKKSRFANVNIIAIHGGGTIPFLSHRIGITAQMPWGYRVGPKLSVNDILEALRSFYLDLTAATSPAALGAILPFISADRLLMGFDFPMMPAPTIAPALQALAANAALDEANRSKIERGTATTLFPRFSR